MKGPNRRIFSLSVFALDNIFYIFSSNLHECAHKCDLIVKMLDFNSILNELQYSYHSVIIVQFYMMFTAWSPLNILKCYCMMPKITRSHMDENEINNIACFVLTALPRVQAFLRILMKDGRLKHSLFFSFLSVTSFVSLCLIIQLKYPKNHRERLRTRQVNCMLIMKSNSMFRGRHLNKRWRNKSFMRIEYYREL